MKIKQTIGLLMWAAMAACTSDMPFEEMTVPEQVISAVEDLVPVEFSASTGYDLTRAATSIVTFTSGEAVKVCVRPDGASDYTGYDFTAATSSQNVTLNAPAAPAAKPYFPPGEGTTVEAYAYYPATAGSAATFSVADNQTTNANYKASDLMYAANRTITKGSTTGTLLTMQHLMAQLALTVNVAQGSGLTISSVTVVAKKSVTFTPADGTATVTGNAGNIIALSGAGTGYVLIPQQTISGVSIKVATGSGTAAETATYNFTSSDNFVAGKSYPITLTVSAQQLGATSAISDWNGQQSVVVEPTGELNFSTIAPVTYDGTAKTPSVTLKDANGTTVPSSGYDLEYKNNTNAGTAIILAVGKGNYAGKVAVTTFTINKASGSISYGTSTVNKTYGDAAFTNTLTQTSGTGTGTVTYGSSDPTVATVNSSGQVTLLKSGSTTITATVADGTNYTYPTKTASYTLNVAKASSSMTLSPTSLSKFESTDNIGETRSFTVTFTNCSFSSVVSATPSSATVSQSGNTITVTRASTSAFGPVTITVSGTSSDASRYNDPANKTITISADAYVPYTMVSAATTSDLGKVICSNGHIHNKVSEVDCGGSGVAVIAYVGSAGSVDASSSTYKGLAVALSDVSGTKAWKSSNDGTCVSQTSSVSTAVGYKNGIESTNTLTSSGHSSHGHAAASACRSYTPAAPTSYTSNWFLPSMGQWQLICQGLATKKAGSSVTTALTTSTNDTYKSSNLNSVITDAGGTGFQANGYWSSTESNTSRAWSMYFNYGNATNYYKSDALYVRAVLAF